jgi:hypothetical protein
MVQVIMQSSNMVGLFLRIRHYFGLKDVMNLEAIAGLVFEANYQAMQRCQRPQAQRML